MCFFGQKPIIKLWNGIHVKVCVFIRKVGHKNGEMFEENGNFLKLISGKKEIIMIMK